MTRPSFSIVSVERSEHAHVNILLPESEWTIICSCQTITPSSRYFFITTNNSLRTLCSFAKLESNSPLLSEKSTFKIAPAALFTVLIFRSDSSEITPVDRFAKMISKFALSASTKFWLKLACFLATDNPLVISLKEFIKKPISSFAGTGNRISKSPLATAFVPSTKFCIGETSLLERTKAPKIEANNEIISTAVSVKLNVLFNGSRR